MLGGRLMLFSSLVVAASLARGRLVGAWWYRTRASASASTTGNTTHWQHQPEAARTIVSRQPDWPCASAKGDLPGT